MAPNQRLRSTLKLMGPRYPVLHLVMIIKRTKPRWANEQCGQPSNQKTGWLWLEPDRKPFIQVGPSGVPTYLNFFFFFATLKNLFPCDAIFHHGHEGVPWTKAFAFFNFSGKTKKQCLLKSLWFYFPSQLCACNSRKNKTQQAFSVVLLYEACR